MGGPIEDGLREEVLREEVLREEVLLEDGLLKVLDEASGRRTAVLVFHDLLNAREGYEEF